MFNIHFYGILWYVSCCHKAFFKYFYNHPLLSSNPSHSAMNVFKFPLCHNDLITHFKLDNVSCYRNYMRILNGCEFDEVIHRFFSDGEWRIVIWIVLTMNCVIKVIAEQGSAFICHNIVVMKQGFYLFCCSINKEK